MLECYPRHRRGYRISHLRIYALFFAGLGGGSFSVSAKNITEKFCSDGNTLFGTFLNHFFWVYIFALIGVFWRLRICSSELGDAEGKAPGPLF